jgi:hypothetical protein
VSPVRYELGFYIPEDDILHSHRRENLKYYGTKACLRGAGNPECSRGLVLAVTIKYVTFFSNVLS